MVWKCTGGGPGEPGPGNPEPPREGKKEWKVDYRHDCDFDKYAACRYPPKCSEDEERMSKWTRQEVYHRGRGWVALPPPDDEWQFDGVECRPDTQTGPSPADVWSAVKRRGVAGVKPQIQPPNGKSLVNLKTNFYVEKEVEKFTVPVGQVDVDVRAIPEAFTWHWDDGTPDKKTSTPGDEYPNLEVVHVYRDAGPVEPSVTIMYRIEWQYNGQGETFEDLLPASTNPVNPLLIVETQSELGD